MTAVKWSMPYMPRLLIVKVPPVNSSGVSGRRAPGRSGRVPRAAISVRRLAVGVADDRDDQPVVGRRRRQPMLIALVPEDLVPGPGGVDLRVGAQRDRAGPDEQVGDADLDVARVRGVDLGAERRAARSASTTPSGRSAGRRCALGEPLRRDPPHRGQRSSRSAVTGGSGRQTHGRATGSDSACRCLVALGRAGDGVLDVGADDAAAGPGAGDGGQVDAVLDGRACGRAGDVRTGCGGCCGGGDGAALAPGTALATGTGAAVGADGADGCAGAAAGPPLRRR